VYTVVQISGSIVVHRGVDLISDEDREHIVGEHLPQSQAQGQVGHPGAASWPLGPNSQVRYSILSVVRCTIFRQT
jgi:hypothetical protein